MEMETRICRIHNRVFIVCPTSIRHPRLANGADWYDDGVDDQEIYAQIGEDGFARLTAAFYRQVAEDDLVGAMYPKHDLAGAEERLRDFLVVRFGGPARYLERRGHPRLRMRHAPFAIGQEARNRWVQMMERALSEAGLPAEAEQTLRAFFASTATFLINRVSAE